MRTLRDFGPCALFVLAAACGSDATDAPSLRGGALSVGGDYAGSGIATHIDLATLDVIQNVVAGVVGGDPVLRRLGDRVVVVDRFGGDSITVLDDQLALIAQVSTGGGSNPQDVALLGDRAYVAALDAPGILVVDLAAPEPGVVDTIDLSSLDPDGVPDCNSVVAIDGVVYATCSLFDRSDFPWQARETGVVVRIDASGGEWQPLSLSRENPFGWMHLAGDKLFVATVPDPFSELTSGCLEVVHLADFSAAGCAVEFEELGGYVASLAGKGEAMWAAVATSATRGELFHFDGSWNAVELAADSNPTDVAVCGSGDVLVADNAPSARGVRVLGADGGERTVEPLGVGWPTVFTPAHALACW